MDLRDIINPIVSCDVPEETEESKDLLWEINDTISTASDEDLAEWLREIRHNRTAETFVIQKKERKAKKVDNVLKNMNPEQMAALLKLLEAK